LNDGSTLRLWGFNKVLVSDATDDERRMLIDPAAAQIEARDDVCHVVMAHHPFNWLKNRKAFEDRCNAVAKIHLFGHEHTRRVDEGKRYLRIRAGAMHPDRDEPDWKPGYNWIDVTVDRVDGKRKDLCRLAFLLEPHAASVTEWFDKPIRHLDPHFLVSKDKVDAGRIASLLLRDGITRAGSHVPLAVLNASFCGRRHSADGDVLTKEANDAFTAAVRKDRTFAAAKPVLAPKFKAIAAEVDPLDQHNPLPGGIAKTAMEAVARASENAVTTLAESVETSLSSAHGDVVRLAEEVDMLWWHIGDWHEMLEKPRSGTPAETKMLRPGSNSERSSGSFPARTAHMGFCAEFRAPMPTARRPFAVRSNRFPRMMRENSPRTFPPRRNLCFRSMRRSSPSPNAAPLGGRASSSRRRPTSSTSGCRSSISSSKPIANAR
jgi:hypothetical protein